MLEVNRLNPPRPAETPSPLEDDGRSTPRPAALDTVAGMFVSADDFDGTGILAGFDPCASNYWWMPELHAAEAIELVQPPARVLTTAAHATRRTPSRPQAAA